MAFLVEEEKGQRKARKANRGHPCLPFRACRRATPHPPSRGKVSESYYHKGLLGFHV